MKKEKQWSLIQGVIPSDQNIELSDDDYAFIRSLAKFDMIMLLGEIQEYGWNEGGLKLLPFMRKARQNGADV